MGTVNIATFILDNDQEVLDIIEETLDKAGIANYKLFTDAELFMDGLNDEIHVCLVDHFLIGKKTGLDILSEIKAKNEHSFVIAYTAMKNPDVIINYIECDIDEFIDKNKKDHLKRLTSYIQKGIKGAIKRIGFSTFIKTERDKLHNG